MKLANWPDSHLTYCTNIHAGESWSEVERALQRFLPVVKQQVCPAAAMGVGLRLSALAARELCEHNALLQAFKQWMQQHHFYVFTLNGFPYGNFHGQSVKERVYQPDWSTPERLEYSRQLADVLAQLLGEQQHGSISTVPVGFKAHFDDKTRLHKAVDNLLQLIAYLAGLEQRSGKLIQFALEPEPGCVLETSADTIAFFGDELCCESALQRLHRYLPASLSEKADIALIKRHLGVCLDTCHAAVMFEPPLAMAQSLMDANIPLYKLQLTAALSVNRLTPLARGRLALFSDDIYLHQTSVCVDTQVNQPESMPSNYRFYPDLDQALHNAEENTALRSHYHVPVFLKDLGEVETTQDELIELLMAYQCKPFCPHLEVETYTFELLPPEFRSDCAAINIARELNWVKEQLSG